MLDDKFDPKRAFDNESFPVEEEERIETVIGHCHFFMLSSGDSIVKRRDRGRNNLGTKKYPNELIKPLTEGPLNRHAIRLAVRE